MKIDCHGQAKILTQSEIQLLFSQGLLTDRDSEAMLLTADHALFGSENFLDIYTSAAVRGFDTNGTATLNCV